MTISIMQIIPFNENQMFFQFQNESRIRNEDKILKRFLSSRYVVIFLFNDFLNIRSSFNIKHLKVKLFSFDATQSVLYKMTATFQMLLQIFVLLFQKIKSIFEQIIFNHF